MHTSFTGSARKARQVNLSGRNVANPWASLSTNPQSTHSNNVPNALANAQADRLRRQQERDKTHAATKIQKIWRGHATRTTQKQGWREEWDHRERKRLRLDTEICYDDSMYLHYSKNPYDSVDLCLEQLKLLLSFLAYQQEKDIMRLLCFGNALEHTLDDAEALRMQDSQARLITRLARLISRRFEYVATQTIPTSEHKGNEVRLLRLAMYVVKLIPEQIADDAAYHLRSSLYLLQAHGPDSATASSIADYMITILSLTTTKQLDIYKAFALEILSSSALHTALPILDYLSSHTRQNLLSCALLQALRSSPDTLDVEQYLWQLSYLIFVRRNIPADSTSFRNWIQALSTLLSHCANDIATRLDELDQPMNGSDVARSKPLDPFVRKEIVGLSERESVEQIVKNLRDAGGQNKAGVSKMAKPLANYAVALLRAFPNKAVNIRMWLYRSSPSGGVTSMSTIQYLWQAAQHTRVFQKVTKDSRSAMSVLTEAAPEHNQIGRAPVSMDEITMWQEEWRIILLFLELYSFILKIMDDEEFFALDEKQNFAASNGTASQFTQGALPLSDVASMTVFLKNLAFPLYWNAAEFAESNEIEDMGGISALFGISHVEPAKQRAKKRSQSLAGNGVSQVYMKGIVTALLRMLHERDSRRTFLSPGHWLMTSHVDMHGFISSVVEEEERRHEVEEESDAQEEDDANVLGESEDTNDALASFTSMFGIRPPHTSRTQISRHGDILAKRRERARKRRQAELLVPRLEILRNLPFFIPFDTRVQIFREFVYRDQVRRRNGWVNPDDWRVSVANGTQGRGLDGRPRGLELINRHHGSIRREQVFQDAFDNFYELGEELKEPIQISFIDQFGSPEAGIDGGGVTKEFLMSVTGEAFDPTVEQPMFVENDKRLLYPNSLLLESQMEILRRAGIKQGSEQFNQTIRDLLRRYEFLGRIIGKCMYEGILVDISFAGFFLLKWALTGGTTTATNETAYRATINDLRDYDSELYKHLLELKNYTGDVEADFGIDFVVTDEINMPDGSTYKFSKDLIPNAGSTNVTNGNRLFFIDKITRYRLQQQPSQVTNAFLKGLGQIIQPMWLAMFNQKELQKLVGGDNAELDISDLRRNTQYGGLYVIGDDGLEHPTVALFWKVLKDMTDQDRRKVLKFVTSTPRAPLLGFSHLNPKFSIRDSSEDQTRLPSTSTCVNLLKLPRYGDEITMREKLLYAVNSGAGFDLS